MFLDYFPIKYRNFSKMFVPLKITSLGVTNVDFGFTTLDNVSIKILEFSKFKLIEFRKKEFRIAIDSEDDLFEYEIFKNIKNSKLRYVFEFFINLFQGANIKFNFSDDKYELNFHNHIEHFKFITLNEFLSQYEKLVTDLRVYKYKNLSSAENSFYELDLLDRCNNLNESSSWVNAKIKCDSDINVGDIITINRLHKIRFDNFPYDIEEVITTHPLTKGEIKFGVINLNRKAVKIKLNKVYKCIEKGLELVPNDYEFLTLKDDVKNDRGYFYSINHYVNEEVDKTEDRGLDFSDEKEWKKFLKETHYGEKCL